MGLLDHGEDAGAELLSLAALWAAIASTALEPLTATRLRLLTEAEKTRADRTSAPLERERKAQLRGRVSDP
jgi:hypothetical protein